ncbi:RSVR protein, partial [Rhagologus leucostigma]|nr:RSVR protein [Rhagologus leucostigma]
PDEFQCAPGDLCFPQDWRCDGHPDCEDDADEWGCGSATAAEPRTLLISGCWLMVLSSRAQSQCPDQGSEWVSACALFSPGLLSILVAAGSVAVWGLSKAKRRSDIFSLEKASREQLMRDQSQ